jgi:Methyltransferase domain
MVYRRGNPADTGHDSGPSQLPRVERRRSGICPGHLVSDPHLRPVNVVETGVAHGLTSRFILEALETIGVGKLWSIDLPPLNPTTRQEVGVAVRQRGVPVDRWTYIAGTSRRGLPALLSRLGRIDLFIHDSMHSNRNVTFELECAWRYLSAGGVIVVDDTDANRAFDTFARAHPEHPSFVCTAEPLSPDMRRFNQKGLFGIICKQSSLSPNE